MRNISIKDLNSSLVPFKAFKAKNAETIWINSDFYVCDAGLKITEEAFKEKFAYLIPNDFCFKNVIFDLEDHAILFAERYGNTGHTGNGGGARCGNVDRMQVKGCGKNPLAAAGDHWHSYGGFSLLESTLELINTRLLVKLLPIGAVDVAGLIFIGHDTALEPCVGGKLNGEDQFGAGAVLVRDVALRPAHFLPNVYFDVSKCGVSKITTEYQRIRESIVALRSFNDGNDGFLHALKVFVGAAAAQFAYARVNRIFHGSLNSSNIAMDGRWIDLTNVSFVEAGFDYQDRSSMASFISEPFVIKDIVFELILNYEKYNRTKLPFFDYGSLFDLKFNTFFRCFGLIVFGFDVEKIDFGNVCPKALSVLSKSIEEAIVRRTVPKDSMLFSSEGRDSVLRLLDETFDSIFSLISKSSQDVISKPRNPVAEALLHILSQSCEEGFERDNINLLIVMYVRSLKSCIFRSFFYKGRLLELIRANKNNGSGRLRELIDSVLYTADWVFSIEEIHSRTLFQSHNIKLVLLDNCHVSILTSNKIIKLIRIRDVKNWIHQNDNFFEIEGYSFASGLCKIFENLAFYFDRSDK